MLMTSQNGREDLFDQRLYAIRHALDTHKVNASRMKSPYLIQNSSWKTCPEQNLDSYSFHIADLDFSLLNARARKSLVTSVWKLPSYAAFTDEQMVFELPL